MAVAKQITRLQVCAHSSHKFALQKLEQLGWRQRRIRRVTTERLMQYEEAVLKELLEQAKDESAQQEQPALQTPSSAALDDAH